MLKLIFYVHLLVDYSGDRLINIKGIRQIRFQVLDIFSLK